jgi:hypothetical protein
LDDSCCKLSGNVAEREIEHAADYGVVQITGGAVTMVLNAWRIIKA